MGVSSMRIARFAAVMLIALPSAALAAQVPITPGSVLTLDRAIQIALTLHPRLLERVSQTGEAGGRLGEAKSALLPQVYGTADYLRSTANGVGNTSYFSAFEPVGLPPFGVPRQTGRNHDLAANDFSQSASTENNYGTGVSISQFLYDFGRVRGFIDQRRAERDAVQGRLKLTQLNLIYEVSQRYFGLLASGEIVKTYHQAVVQREQEWRQAALFAKSNLRPELDVYVTKADLARAQLHLVQAQDTQADAKVALDNAMGLSGKAPVYQLQGKLGYGSITDRLRALLEQAFRQRPDLLILKDDIRAAGAQIVQAQSDLYPTFSAQAGYIGMGTGLPMVNNGYLGLVITWPIFNGYLTESQIDAARFKREAAAHALDDLVQRVIFEVQSAFLNWTASIKEIERAQETLLGSRTELALASERYRTGLGNIVDVQVAQRRFVADNTAYINALYGYSVAKAQVDRATARSLAEH